MKKFFLFLILAPILGLSQKNITGTVFNEEGDVIPGVNIYVKNYTQIATITDVDGKYQLTNVPDDASFLVFIFMGMKTKEISITDTVINVVLESGDVELSECIVTAMGTKKRIFRKNNRNAQYTSFEDIEDINANSYNQIKENQYQIVMNNPLSTFSIDVDNASYSQVRTFLKRGQLPPKDAVRIEEMINYFDYNYPAPTDDKPFSVITEIADAPWNPEHKIIHIGIQGKKIDYQNLKPSNLVFLIDVSGSMKAYNKLDLVKKSLKLLVRELSDKDYISIVVYAGAAGLVLPPTKATDTTRIFSVLDELTAGGSTAGGAGIKLAYKTAKKNLIKDGNNRVILVTDGDFNVGTTSSSELIDLTTKYRTKDDIYLTICGFGMGNYKDDRMEEISNAANGNYFYIDNLDEAKKVFVKDLRANMFTIAKDVKIQVEFNPYYVRAYRLIGYENRVMDDQDFDDDTKDAGELGAGHSVTALYEIIPVNSKDTVGQAIALKYQQTTMNETAKNSGEIMTLKLRYKPVKSNESLLISKVVKNNNNSWQNASDNFKFSASVAAFGMLLRQSEFIDNFNYKDVLNLAQSSYNKDDKYQAEFLELVILAKILSRKH